MEVLGNEGLRGHGLAQLGTVQAGISGQLPWSPGRGMGGMGSSLGAGNTVQPRFHVGAYGKGMQDPAVNGLSGMAGPAGGGLAGRLSKLAVYLRGWGS